MLQGKGAKGRVGSHTEEALGVLMEIQCISGQHGFSSGKPEASLVVKCLFSRKRKLI